jgi:peptidoglycan/xylan/chitin deacetylase (PgdA/CDA1 family)
MGRVTLSFDNSPHQDITPRVLDVLARYAVKASFFAVGERIRNTELYREAERAHDAGHWIGNHSMTHTIPLGEDRRPDAPEQEIGAAQDLLGRLSHSDRFFRPFGGGGHLDRRLLSLAARDYLIQREFTCVVWNVVPRDWEDPEGWVERTLQACSAQEEALVVLHDHLPSAVAKLDSLITRLKDAGHTIVQEFPAACVPIVRGAVAQDLALLLSDVDGGQRHR